MYYFYYFIRIFREIFGRRVLKKFFIISLIVIAIILLKNNHVFGYTGLEGNDEYTDPNNSIYQIYDGYLNDLAIRLNNSSDEDAEDLLWRLGDGYSFVCFYGTSSAGNYNDFKHLRVVLFDSSVQFNDSSAYNIWNNMHCQFVYNSTNNGLIYDFTDMDCVKSSLNTTIYVPYMLINRYNQSLVEVLASKTDTSTSSIVSAINSQTVKIEEQTDAIEAQTDAITDSSFDENEVDIDTSSVDNVDQSTYTGLFTTIFTSFNNAIQSNHVEYIRVPIPHSVDNLIIPSNIVSKHLEGAFLALINGFWFYLFGFYGFKFVNNLIVKIKEGSILDGYSSSDVISSDMM